MAFEFSPMTAWPDSVTVRLDRVDRGMIIPNGTYGSFEGC